MINFTNSLLWEYIYARSESRYVNCSQTYSLISGHSGGVGSVCCAAGWPSSSYQFSFIFGASTKTPDSADETFGYSLESVAVASNPSYPNDGGSSSGTQNFTYLKINSLSAQQSEPLEITTVYNTVFDSNLTNQQVFDELQSIYGSQYKQFGMQPKSGALSKIGGISNASFDGNPAHIDFHDSDCCTNWKPSDNYVPSDYYGCFNAAKAIDSDYLTIIGNQQLRAAVYLLFTRDIPAQKLVFDVYVDGVIGEKGPQTVIKWHDYNSGDDSIIAHSLVTPKIWGWPVPQEESPDIVSTPPIVTINGIKVPNETDADHSRTQMNQSFEWDGEYSTPYVSLSNNMIGWRPTGDQIAYFGLDKICDKIRFYLRFDYQKDNAGTLIDTWGDLYYVDIPYEYAGAAYISAVQVTPSDNNKQYETEVNIIGGLPPVDPEPDDDEPEGGEDPEGTPSGDGPYAPDGYEDLSDGEPDGFDGDAVLTTTYSMPKLTMQSVGADLWSQTYFNVLKIQSNPIENIIACKWYPMSITGTPNTPIKIGDVTLGVSADKIGTMYTKSFGSYKHATTTGRPGYLSMTPYCIVKLHLPYVGVVQLDATEIYKRNLTGKYVVDLITGDVLVILYLDGNPYMTLTGKMGVDIPLTSTNRVQTELAAASRTLSAVIGGAGHLMAADAGGAVGAAASGIMSIMGMDYSSQRCTSHSPACCTYENLWIFVEVQYNPTKVSAGYKAQRGLPAHLYQTLQYMKNQGGGFVQIDGRTTINVAMTDEENRMLEQIMTSGFYL